EPVVNAISPASDSDNQEAGTKALTRLVREVLEEVFEARIGAISETLQDRCMTMGRGEIAVLRGLPVDFETVAPLSISPMLKQNSHGCVPWEHGHVDLGIRDSGIWSHNA
ncbi:hypothetical protein J1N35_026512, partial [Gossypium stocksii]